MFYYVHSSPIYNCQKLERTQVSLNRRVDAKKCGAELNNELSTKEYLMVEKHLKKFSTSLIIREIQIKTVLRFHLIPFRMVKIKNSGDSRCW